jgi:hypothetical protein
VDYHPDSLHDTDLLIKLGVVSSHSAAEAIRHRIKRGEKLEFPPHVVVCKRGVKYRYGDVIAWIRRNKSPEAA